MSQLMRHRKRQTRLGTQCACGAPSWSWRHIAESEIRSLLDPILWRYGWYRRLMTPTYQCPECRHAYHYCKC
ncbi:hypothetical protein SEA_MAHAVRAT_88 [Mycobacterium phage Mahavrat]|uniref:Uncharacterized protein n=1 Tax=Mycobacterium phage Mahavrat TaxID=2591129 RepID=A0A515MLD0_9CAUD|nr:hypothetical protein I5H59_gp88 [Mycobacterium phage Mahavrat]QDM57472.1 hypothetical protein SEA_MAHAVRAT_88 [Mycobacterium phage Mahavrat]WNM74076.1 hypothetical protein SEA_LUNABLU_96 [Mycobacterium Phage LunaBlu]